MRLSILHLIFAGILTAIFVVFIFAKWEGKNSQIKTLNSEILAMQEKISSADELGKKALAYVRISRGLDIMVGEKLSDEQKGILAEKLLAISTDYKIDPVLILAVIRHESRGDPNARGTYTSGAASGALGLMQIKYESAKEVASSIGVEINSREDLFVPEKNLMVGTAYLLRLIAKYKDLQHALIAYNVGFGTLDEKLKSGDVLPSRYYNKVMQDYKFLTKEIFLP
ncbi:MAG: transglycosylase SLT domain-containing protein [Candidatus Fibromonas sp.]|jgi:soluble lytic murein transglycosylase|nr:transglycosylase SLT domain-containing protein [Candidatus Fibromonas sp.]